MGFERAIANIRPDTVFKIGNFPIVNSTLLQIVVVIIVGITAWYSARNLSVTTPSKAQIWLEAFYEVVEDFIASVAGKAKAWRILPLGGALLVFILLQNVIALLPGIGAITINDVAMFRTSTSDFNTTLGLALVSIIVIHGAMIVDQGVFGYIGNFVKIKHVFTEFKKGITSGLLSLVDLFIGLLDIVGEFAKILSLSLRLFGNLFAGDVLMTILLGIVAFGVPGVWLLMSTLGAVVQSVVFAALVTVFFSLAINEETR
jgi:F-type H+-transporting ATPase subunit a